MKLLKSPWLVGLLGVLLFFGVTAVVLKKHKLGEGAAVGEESEAKTQAPAFWEVNSAEVDQLIEELKNEKAQVAAREQQLNDLEARLQTERGEVNQATQRVFQLQKEFDRTVVRVREEEAGNLKRMAKIYTIMSTDGAVGILKNLEDDQIVKLLVFMKESETAPILETLAKLGDADAKRAAKLSEQLRHAVYHNPATKSSPP